MRRTVATRRDAAKRQNRRTISRCRHDFPISPTISRFPHDLTIGSDCMLARFVTICYDRTISHDTSRHATLATDVRLWSGDLRRRRRAYSDLNTRRDLTRAHARKKAECTLRIVKCKYSAVWCILYFFQFYDLSICVSCVTVIGCVNDSVNCTLTLSVPR